MNGVWSNFSDIVNFKYEAEEVDKDIRHLLKTGEFKPAYTDIVRNFLIPEIANCKHTLEDENHLLEVHLQGSMSEDALTRTPEEITPILDWLDYSPDKRQFWFDYYVHPKHGRQKAPPISALQNGNKKVIITPFGLSVDAFYSVYTEIHELMHGVQGKYYLTSKEKEEYNQEHYELLYQGKSRDEANDIQKAKHLDLKKELYCDRCFKEMQANSAATCYMMLQAVKTGDENIISMVEKRLLNESASMSGALMNENLGLAYFEYPATKKIIEEIKQGNCSHLLNDKGLLDWKALYKYTKEKVDEMGYSKDDMYASLETAKILKKIKSEHPKNQEEFLSAVLSEATHLSHPHNKICTQFVDAQRDFTFDNSKNLHHFYHRLDVESERKRMLETASEQIVPNIEEYRKIYQQSENIKNLNKLNMFASKKGRFL